MPENDQNGRKSLGIEVSALALNAVLLDEAGAIADTRRSEFPAGTGTVEKIRAFVDEIRPELGSINKMGVAVPGLVQHDTRRIAFSAHIPEHSERDLASEIRQATGFDSVIENDANAAALGEFRLGAGRESQSLFYATLGAGVGGAFIFNGMIWRGTSGFAGEFGYVAINSEGMRLEDVASSANILRRTRSRIRQDHTSSLWGMDEYSIKISDILSAAAVEDDLAQMMLQRTGEYVGTAVASVINLLNVETVVLGGELMEAGHLVLDAVVSRAKELSFGPSFASTRIVAGTLGRHASAAGAALTAREA